MNPQTQFCPNLDCPARGQTGKGNIGVHSRKKPRFVCHVCQRTFTNSKGTLFYRLHHDPQVVLCVITLLAHGCPLPAIVPAFGLDERTVRTWWARAGRHCQAVHAQKVGQSQLDLQQVQADELKVKTQRGWLWMALALMVSTRLWLGGAVSAQRDEKLARRLADQVRAVALCRPLLIAVDGWWAYLGAFRKAFRTKLERRPGEGGRPPWIAWSQLALVQVIKPRPPQGGEIQRRVVQGCQRMVAQLILATQPRGGINTAYIERFNATIRQRLDSLTRRTRTLVCHPETLSAGMWVMGCVYNFCTHHQSLRLKLWVGRRSFRWVPRTPAMAAGLADHRWSMAELFLFKPPPPPWRLPKRWGRYPNTLLRLAEQWSS